MATHGSGGGGSSNFGRGINVSVTSINCNDVSNSTTLGASGTAVTMSSSSLPSSSSSSSSVSSTTNGGSSSGAGGGGGHFYGTGGIRISVPKMEESDESDTELSNIEKTAKVSLRNSNSKNKDIPRPMSWEGELSEHEDMMQIDTKSNGESSKIIKYSGSALNHENVAINLKTTAADGVSVKPELGQTSFDTNPTFSNNTVNKKYHTDVINLKYEPNVHDGHLQPHINSPLLARSKTTLFPANPSPDSAIHSIYTHSSPSQSPLTSRHAIYTPSLSRNNSDASHSSCYSYSSEFSPTHSPIQGRHHMYGATSNFNGSPLHHSVLYRPMVDGEQSSSSSSVRQATSEDGNILENEPIPSAGISRQQLINSPCPVCGDKISGFHYGIFSCESCKGFFKRTVQNRKNYVCVRGAACPVTIATRKKCPACRFEKCLQRGMKLEAIREDRTRGGRSTYQCSFTLPGSMLSPSTLTEPVSFHQNYRMTQNGTPLKLEVLDSGSNSSSSQPGIPPLLQEIMDVDHLWQYNDSELLRLNQPPSQGNQSGNPSTNPLLASAGLAHSESSNPDLIANLCNIADHRLYKIVKWSKSLPLFKHISIDDQICLLINSWCELLMFSCCFRSMTSPGEILISLGKSITLAQSKTSGLQACIERMLNLTDHLRRLRVDKYEYVAMKVIILLQSDTSELKEPEKVRTSQEKALQALQAYTIAHYPDSPAKFGELLLRIPELQRTCQISKEMLTIKSKDGEEFNLLMELLRGEH